MVAEINVVSIDGDGAPIIGVDGALKLNGN